MRVIAGSLGGRLFDSPHSHRTHPMSDRVRGALFGTLGDIVGLTVLDAFAGTGALGFEAVSRGASSALLIEYDMLAQRTIDENIELLGLQEQVHLMKANAIGWSNKNRSTTFDLVLADPPFDKIQTIAVEKLGRHVAVGGLFVLCWPGIERLPAMPHMELVEHKRYGDAQLGFYRHSD